MRIVPPTGNANGRATVARSTADGVVPAPVVGAGPPGRVTAERITATAMTPSARSVEDSYCRIVAFG